MCKATDEHKKRLVGIIHEISYTIHPPKVSQEEVALMIGTAAVESDFVHRKQIGGGPARGLWGVEIPTAYDNFVSYLRHRPAIWTWLATVWLKWPGLEFQVPGLDVIEYNLIHNDLFCCAMARLKYWRDPHRIPKTIEDMAAYYKRVYNTAAGAGTEETYLKKWHLHLCDGLVDYWRAHLEGNRPPGYTFSGGLF